VPALRLRPALLHRALEARETITCGASLTLRRPQRNTVIIDVIIDDL
jgi:hypothetical protein